MYRPQANFNVPMKILVPVYKTIQGVTKKTYPRIEDVTDEYLFFGNFKTYGGTETKSNDVLMILDTAVVESWFRPDIKSDCRICLLTTGRIYEVISPPENIEMRNQFMQFKIQSVGGKS